MCLQQYKSNTVPGKKLSLQEQLAALVDCEGGCTTTIICKNVSSDVIY